MNENELYQCPYEKACKCRMDEPCKGCETWAEALTKKTEPVAKLQCSDGLDGPFMKAWACVDCGTLLTWKEKMDSFGSCPYCGHTVTGTVVETDDYPMKQPEEKKATIGERWRYFKAMFSMW